MHYSQHTPSPEDLTLMRCSTCGWTSDELTRDQVADMGVPLACRGACGQYGIRFIRFHPSERAAARRALLGDAGESAP